MISTTEYVVFSTLIALMVIVAVWLLIVFCRERGLGDRCGDCSKLLTAECSKKKWLQRRPYHLACFHFNRVWGLSE